MSQQRVREALQAAEGYLSGEELSRDIGITRAAVWKAVENLRRQGYDIEARTGKGYRLRQSPDLLRRETVEPYLTARRENWQVLETVDSTNSLCRRLALEGAPDGTAVLAICGGYQMLGQYYKTWDGAQCDFTGALDLYTVGSEQRMIGNYMFSCEEAGCNIVGFENHSGKTYLGSGVRPLGRVLEGSGNNGEDGTEGARYKNVFASYSHGCLLPKNPKLADLILQTALERKYGALTLPPLPDTLETAAHTYMENRLTHK